MQVNEKSTTNGIPEGYAGRSVVVFVVVAVGQTTKIAKQLMLMELVWCCSPDDVM